MADYPAGAPDVHRVPRTIYCPDCGHVWEAFTMIDCGAHAEGYEWPPGCTHCGNLKTTEEEPKCI